MAYRPKPAMAAWIQGERKRLGLSTKELSERLALIGVTVGEQTISVWESYAGRNPSPRNIDALERLYGSQAPGKADEAPDVDLAAAIRELTDELREMRRERGRIADLEQTVGGLTERLRVVELATSRAPESPRVGAGSGR